jgi:hypothetical protein
MEAYTEGAQRSEPESEDAMLEKFARRLFVLWLVLLAPWLFLAPLALMAFDAGPTSEAYVFVYSIWTYPVAVGIVAIFRKKIPGIVLLPSLNILALLSVS